MEEMQHTHKEPAWGWIGALLEARQLTAPAPARPADAPIPQLKSCRKAS